MATAIQVNPEISLSFPATLKRTMDLLFVAMGLPFIPLIILVLALLVRLESPGSAFFAHSRIGRHRVPFLTWKLRTMHVHGDELLAAALASSPALRDEWACFRKLQRDPRVTRMGHFLRKTSLDELPQFWNVLRGEMSLVGPRPIVEEEADLYGADFALYLSVLPGLTGLWQVSGRSHVGRADRVRLDCHYVRNWSAWLDLRILLRTAWVVLTAQGAW